MHYYFHVCVTIVCSLRTYSCVFDYLYENASGFCDGLIPSRGVMLVPHDTRYVVTPVRIVHVLHGDEQSDDTCSIQTLQD